MRGAQLSLTREVSAIPKYKVVILAIAGLLLALKIPIWSIILKSNKNSISLGQHVLHKRIIGLANALLG